MENEARPEEEEEKKRSFLTSVIVGGVGAFSVLYLLNPTMGIIELIPDALPVIGNLDEAAAAGLLISCLNYFGFDFGALFGRREEEDGKSDDDVIDVEVEDR